MAKRRKPAAKTESTKQRRGSDSDRNAERKVSDELDDAKLEELRDALDRVDRDIMDRIYERGCIAEAIGHIKTARSLPFYDPEREANVVENAVLSNMGPLSNAAVEAIFREIVSGCRAAQMPTRVAYLGPQFTFSHLAAIARFGQSAELVPVASIAAVFEEVERGQSQFGVVPMENSTDGRVSDTLECFARSPVRICAGLPLRIHHCLLGMGARDQVRTVYSKPQPLSQCRNWLARHLPNAELHEVASSAEAARRAKEDRQAAAVASAQAGVNYGLPVLVQNIEDNPDNVTRFAVISIRSADRTGNDKTALMLEIAHQPGALADAMSIFKRNRLNMTWIESYPIPGSLGRYLFFVEFIGHQADASAKRAIAALAKSALRLEVLGSYAQSEPIG
jgi:chorismate mutase/prephenate dehydratase